MWRVFDPICMVAISSCMALLGLAMLVWGVRTTWIRLRSERLPYCRGCGYILKHQLALLEQQKEVACVECGIGNRIERVYRGRVCWKRSLAGMLLCVPALLGAKLYYGYQNCQQFLEQADKNDVEVRTEMCALDYGDDDLWGAAGMLSWLPFIQAEKLRNAAWCERVVSVSAKDMKVSTLSFLRNHKYLRKIEFESTAVSDLKPLQGLKRLRWLNLSGTEVTDISPLRDMFQLEHLHLSQTKVQDISALQNSWSLWDLDLSHTQVEDLSSLSRLGRLRELNLDSTQVSDLTPLQNANRLYLLNLSHTQVRDIQPLQGLHKIHFLNLSHTPLKSIALLKEFTDLGFVDLSHTEVCDLGPLRYAKKLELLYICHTPVADVSMLGCCKELKYIDLSHTPIQDVSFLEKLKNVRYLDLSHTQISDLSAISDFVSLIELSISHTQIRELPSHMAANMFYGPNPGPGPKLDISYTPVSDISALLESPSEVFFFGVLDITATPVTPESLGEFQRLYPDCEIRQ